MRRGGGLLIAVAVLAWPGSASAAATWLPSVSPFGTDGTALRAGTSVIAPDGTVTAVRASTDGTVHVRTRPPGGPIGPDQTVASDGDTGSPAIVAAVGPTGDVVVAYRQAGNVYRAVLRRAGGAFGAPFGLVTSVTAPALRFGADGTLWFTGMNGTGGLVGRITPGGTIQTTTAAAAGGSTVGPLTPAPTAAGGATVSYVITSQSQPVPTSCIVSTSLDAYDISPAFAVGPVTHLHTETATNVTNGFCAAPDSGAQIDQAALAGTAAGAQTLVYGVRTFGGSGGAGIFGLRRPAGGAWVTAPETIRATDAYRLALDDAAGTPVLAFVDAGIAAPLQVASRDADGWLSPAALPGSATSWEEVQVAGGSDGSAVVAGIDYTAHDTVRALRRTADGALGPLVAVSPAGSSGSGRIGAIGFDADGDALVSWARATGAPGQYGSEYAPLDAAGPRLGAATFPAGALAGSPASFAANAVDVFSAVSSVRWDFGDGTTSTDAAAAHTYAAAGTYGVTLSATDALGNASARQATVGVTAAPPPGGSGGTTGGTGGTTGGTTTTAPADRTAPRFTVGLRVAPRRPTRRRTVAVTFRIDEGGALTLTRARLVQGIRRGGRCVAAPRHPRQGTRRCDRLVGLTRLHRSVAAGSRRVTLGRLASGRWRVSAVVRDPAGNTSAASRVIFRVR